MALILRLTFIFLAPSYPMQGGDASFFDAIAQNIAAGHGLVAAQDIEYIKAGQAIFENPGYPLFLAGIYSLFGHSYLIVKIFQALLWSLTCLIIYFLGKEFFNQKVGFIAGIISAVYPPFILETNILYTETLFTFLLLVAILFLVKGISKINVIGCMFLSGLFFGLANLTRSVIFYFPIFVLIFLLIFYKNKIKALKAFILLLIGIMLVMGPWMTRNFLISKFSQEGISLAKEYTKALSGERGVKSIIMDTSLKKIPSLVINRLLRLYGLPHGLVYIQSDISYKKYLLERNFSILRQKEFWFKLGITFLHWLILLGAIAGVIYWAGKSLSITTVLRCSPLLLHTFQDDAGVLVYTRKRNKSVVLLLLIVFYITLATLTYSLMSDATFTGIQASLASTTPRYVFPIMPYIIIFAAYGIFQLHKNFNNLV